MYSPAIFHRYLFCDEMALFGHSHTISALFGGIKEMAVQFGRPVTGFLYYFLDLILKGGPWGIVVLRSVAVIALIAGALVFFHYLRVLAIPPINAGLVTLLVWSHPGLAIFAYYAQLAPYWVGMIGAFVSFGVFFKNKDRPIRIREALLHCALFGVGLLTFQMTPFAAAGFIAYFAINDRKAQYLERTLRYAAILLLTVSGYAVAFKIGSKVFGMGGYHLAAALMNSSPLALLKRQAFFSVWEFWNYPVAVPALPAHLKETLALEAAALWCILFGLACRRDFKNGDRQVMARWALALLVTAAALLPVFAAGSDDRQHLQTGAAMALVLVGYGALAKLRHARFGAPLGSVLAVMIAIIAVGAARDGVRGIVRPYANFMSVVGREIARQEAKKTGHTTLAVVPLDRTPGSAGAAEAAACPDEPCAGYYGHRYPSRWHERRAVFYRIAALTAGGDDKFTTIFVSSRQEAPSGAMVLDLQDYPELHP